eukprot:TRINITY_DN2779_c1_g1_i5.p1 TRINITY_DN2779_c1_g1~~TRINITY_DN2779_c1_g1_i5.p1  ORF type:complete len:1181 (-),score=281.53 TRINITY_DN2779_c1_g1_i5:381-3923(-)
MLVSMARVLVCLTANVLLFQESAFASEDVEKQRGHRQVVLNAHGRPEPLSPPAKERKKDAEAIVTAAGSSRPMPSSVRGKNIVRDAKGEMKKDEEAIVTASRSSRPMPSSARGTIIVRDAKVHMASTDASGVAVDHWEQAIVESQDPYFQGGDEEGRDPYVQPTLQQRGNPPPRARSSTQSHTEGAREGLQTETAKTRTSSAYESRESRANHEHARDAHVSDGASSNRGSHLDQRGGSKHVANPTGRQSRAFDDDRDTEYDPESDIRREARNRPVMRRGEDHHSGDHNGGGRPMDRGKSTIKQPVEGQTGANTSMITNNTAGGELRQKVNGSTPAGHIELGTPKKRVYVILDTGSDKLVAKTWDTIQRELRMVDGGIDDAVQPSPLVYDHNSSSSYVHLFSNASVRGGLHGGRHGRQQKQVQKRGYIAYGSGVAITDEGMDTVHVGGETLTRFPISEIAADSLSMLHTSAGIAGILGLQHMKNKSVGESVFSRSRQNGRMYSFGYCRGDNNDGTFIWGDKSTEGTKLNVIGQIHWALKMGEVKMTRNKKPEEEKPAPQTKSRKSDIIVIKSGGDSDVKTDADEDQEEKVSSNHGQRPRFSVQPVPQQEQQEDDGFKRRSNVEGFEIVVPGKRHQLLNESEETASLLETSSDTESTPVGGRRSRDVLPGDDSDEGSSSSRSSDHSMEAASLSKAPAKTGSMDPDLKDEIGKMVGDVIEKVIDKIVNRRNGGGNNATGGASGANGVQEMVETSQQFCGAGEPNGCAAIIDTGSNIIAGPVGALREMAKFAKIKYDCSNLDELPTMHLAFGDLRITLPPKAYVMQVKLPKWVAGNRRVQKEAGGQDESSADSSSQSSSDGSEGGAERSEGDDGPARGSGRRGGGVDGGGGGGGGGGAEASDGGDGGGAGSLDASGGGEADDASFHKKYGNSSRKGGGESLAERTTLNGGRQESGWHAAMQDLHINYGVDLMAFLEGINLEQISRDDKLCMPAFAPLDKETSVGKLWVVGTPLFEKYYTRFSWLKGEQQPHIFFKEKTEAKACGAEGGGEEAGQNETSSSNAQDVAMSSLSGSKALGEQSRDAEFASVASQALGEQSRDAEFASVASQVLVGGTASKTTDHIAVSGSGLLRREQRRRDAKQPVAQDTAHQVPSKTADTAIDAWPRVMDLSEIRYPHWALELSSL